MKFILLSKQNYKPRTQFPTLRDVTSIRHALSYIPDDEIPHIDIESDGLDERTCEIKSIGIAFSKGHFCCDLREPGTLAVVIEWLWLRKGTYGAFNSSFDSLFIAIAMRRQFPGRKLYEYTDKMSEDSYVSFKMLANEDNTPRNLDIAIKYVLGWPETSYQKDWLKEALATHELVKGDMWKLLELEHEGFTLYNSLDAEASYQLESYTRGFIEAANFDSLAKVKKLYIQDIRLAVEAQMHGLAIDMIKLRAYKVELDVQVSEALRQFAEHPKVAPCIKHYNEVVYEAYHRPVVSTKTIWAKKSDQAHLNPEVWTKKLRNKPAKWEQEYGSWFRVEYNSRPPKRTAEPSWFNPGSDTDLLWLFYGKAKNSTGQEPWKGLVDYKVTRQPDPENEKSWERYGIVEAYFENGKSLTWSMTSGGELPIDQDFRGMFGEPGKLLNAWVTLQGVQVEVDKLLEAAGDGGRIYPGKRAMATVTGRSGSSGKIGMLTLTKVRRYLECFVPDPGYTIIQADASQLEDVILAEMSQDPMMKEIYGSGKPHDGYLAFAAMYDPRSTEIQELYDVQNPTKEGVAEAKRVFKSIRKAWKVVKLSCIAEGTLIRVKDFGYLPIEEITSRHTVWDGVEWVSCDGAVCNGEATVIDLEGIRCTRDHRFLTNKGWTQAQYLHIPNLVRPKSPPNISLGEIQQMGNILADVPKSGSVSKVYDLMNCGPRNQFMVGNLIAHNCNYGAGVVKIQRNMAAKEDIWMTLPETKETLDAYKAAVAVTEEWKASLVQDWQQTSGFIYNGLGRPMCVPDTYIKDLSSRKIQSSGRDCLAIFMFYIHYYRVQYGVEMVPWLPDVHDETMWTCKNEDLEKGLRAFKDAATATNKVLNWGMQIKFDPETGDNLNVFKEGRD